MNQAKKTLSAFQISKVCKSFQKHVSVIDFLSGKEADLNSRKAPRIGSGWAGERLGR